MVCPVWEFLKCRHFTEMPWLNLATTLVQAWDIGSEAGRAIAKHRNIIFTV